MKNTTILLLGLFLSLASISKLGAQIQNPKDLPFDWKTDTSRYNIDLSELTMVLPRRSFPIIDYPKFIGKTAGLKSFFKDEPVICAQINGQTKAYPLNMLTIHEISNDTLGGIPILATYCPLCNSGIIYDRSLNYEGEEYLLEFEVSGMLRKSDMVMFDRQTESWWQQLMGSGIAGTLTGAELDIIPSLILSVEDFFESYPDGLILSKASGNEEAQKFYGSNFYVGYDATSAMPYDRFFDAADVDMRLPAMERVVDIESNGKYKIYPFSIISKKEVINDQFDSLNVVLFYQKGMISILDKKDISESRNVGSVSVFNSRVEGQVLTFRKKGKNYIDEQTGSKWNISGKCLEGTLKGKQLSIQPYSNHFAFAWLAFHPDSEIYGE